MYAYITAIFFLTMIPIFVYEGIRDRNLWEHVCLCVPRSLVLAVVWPLGLPLVLLALTPSSLWGGFMAKSSFQQTFR